MLTIHIFTKKGIWHLPPTFAIIIHIPLPLRPCIWRPRVPYLMSSSPSSRVPKSPHTRPDVPVPLSPSHFYTQPSRCTFQSTKSEMRPTLQNIDCFKHETGSIIEKLTFSTVNPEKFLAYNSSLWSGERSKFLILEYCETRLFARSSLHARSMKPTLMIFFHVSFSTHNGSLYTRA